MGVSMGMFIYHDVTIYTVSKYAMSILAIGFGVIFTILANYGAPPCTATGRSTDISTINCIEIGVVIINLANELGHRFASR